ncbi:MAG: SpoIID/LytB domain protein [Frankiales bacterium]|nr:SpoIID/LytB domain protein [Frankiales bacterium]
MRRAAFMIRWLAPICDTVGRIMRRLSAVLAAALVLAGAPVLAAHAAGEAYDVPADGALQLEGHAWGHGHGLSQVGAQGAASQGVTGTQIVSTYYPNTTAGTVADAPIRVLLQADDGADLQVAAATGLAVRDLASGKSYTLPSGPTRWRIFPDTPGLKLQQMTGGAWYTYQVTDPATNTFITAFAGPVQFEGATPQRLYYPDGTARDYRGVLRANQTAATRMQSIDVLGMEDYLLGVVPRESPSSYPAEALKAQSIAARSYSAYKRQRVASGATYDICDTTQCQVFGGSTLYPAGGGSAVNLEPASTTAAVRATAGQVRLSNGQPIFAEFGSSNGGWSVDGGQPYLVAAEDPWDGITNSSVHSWKATVTAADLQKRFPSVGTLRRLTVLSRDGNGDWGGRVTQVQLDGVDANGNPTTVTTTGAGIYLAKQWPSYGDGMRSSWWHITSAPSPSPSASPSDTPVAPAPARSAGVTRVAGADRFGTAASVSAASFPGTANDVLIVTGADWPDALAAGAAAASVSAPVLPVQAGAVPGPIADELTRLKPRRAWVVGGTAAVSDAVVAQLQTRGITVQRVSGADRYATAAAVQRQFFASPAGAYYASGATYADALAGGAAAARRGWPLLLTAPGALPASTPVVGTDRIVLGGPVAISEQVRTRLQARRVAGADRYDTATAIAKDAFPRADVVYLATGLNFPDALAGAPAGFRDGAPLLLAATDCVTKATRDEAAALGARSRMVLGGQNAVSDRAAAMTAC